VTGPDHYTLTTYYRRNRVAILSKTISVSLAAVAVAFPISILTSIKRNQVLSLGVVVIFVLIFHLMLIVCSKLKQQELFAVTAAYAAILVVFLGNSPAQNASSPNGQK
jgi:lipopolysaccharide export LptBFGC system permease protein LptF